MKLSTLVSLVAGASLASGRLSQAPIKPIEPTSSQTTELLALHKSLVDISSISGNESTVAHWLASYFEAHDFTVELQTVVESPLRQNVFAYPKGGSRKTKTLISSHIDVVPPYWPYEVRNDGTEIWGRGSVDAKGSVAAQITAVKALQKAQALSAGDIALLYVVGEERGGEGMKAANDLGLFWDAVIFGEPTELKLAAGHKGALGIVLKAHGKAGHSGYPELGRNANSLLVDVLWALAQESWPRSDKYGNTTLNVGTISGGVAPNVIAESAEAVITVRVAAGTVEDLREQIRKVVSSAGGGHVEVEFPGEGYGTVPLDHDVDGFETIVVNYGTDVPNLLGDHKRYLYGPGDILVAHSDHEHLKVTDLETAVEGYKKLILASLK